MSFVALQQKFSKLFPASESLASIARTAAFIDENRERLRGKRCFVIGNGPSLNLSDLEKIQNEITIASNLIYLAFGQTSWRPTWISVTDPLVWRKFEPNKIPAGIPILIDSSFPDLEPNLDVIRFHRFARFERSYYTVRAANQRFSPEVSRGYFGGHSVTYFNIQLAFSLGMSPVYLLGVDHRFTSNASSYFSRLVTVRSTNDHFHPDYRRNGETVKSAPTLAIQRYMSSVLRLERNYRFSLVDLTRGGALQDIPKANFEDIV